MLPRLDVCKKSIKYSMTYGATAWEVQGIDVSKWNGSINFAITKTKCQYVYIRYGYGNGWKDPSADVFYANARANDMPVGAYWFCNIGEDPIRHIDGFCDELATKPVQLDQVLDAERTIVTPSQTLEWLKTADGRLRSKTNKVGKTYTSMGFWNSNVARSSYWIGRALWDANWTTRDSPIIPLDWTTWEDWQWSADGNRKAAEYGSTGGDPDMDLDRYNGSIATFNLKYHTHIQPIGGTVTPPPPQPPGTVPDRVIINTGELSIHSTPQAIQTNVMGHALINTSWYPSEIVTANGITWYKLDDNGYISKNYTRLP
jgi:GH25 family lysozyme M1 (1,4-beta-N-acetylmuramidase)